MSKLVAQPPVPLLPVRLSALATVFAGIGVSREDTVTWPGEALPVIGVRHLQDAGVAPVSELDEIGFSAPERARESAVEVGDVLLTGRGTLLKFGLVGPQTAGAIASGNIIVIRPGPQVVGGALFALLSSEAFRPKIEVLRRGATTLLSLSAKDVANLEVSLPPLAEQQAIAALVIEGEAAYRAALDAAELRRALTRSIVADRLFSRHRSGNPDA